MRDSTLSRRLVGGSVAALIAACGPAAPIATPTARVQSPPAATTPAPATVVPTGTPAAVSPSPSPGPTQAPISPGTIDSEPALEQVWQATGPTGGETPFHPAIDPERRIWVPAAPDNQFLIFDREGNYIETWGESGSGEGQFNFASEHSDMFGGIAFAPDGSFYVSESGNRRVAGVCHGITSSGSLAVAHNGAVEQFYGGSVVAHRSTTLPVSGAMRPRRSISAIRSSRIPSSRSYTTGAPVSMVYPPAPLER
jgi:hypothetical protein